MGKKLFIIEEDANVLYGLQAKFSLAGFKVGTDTGSRSSEEIIQRVKEFIPEFIILELALSLVDGFSVLDNLRRDEHIVRVPIFIFSSIDDSISKERAKNLGAEYYFPKNRYMVDDFIMSVNKIIINRKKLLIS